MANGGPKKTTATKCENCIDGVWARRWVHEVGGGMRPIGGSGPCYQCGGKGHQTAADRRRNEAYRRYAINRELGNG
jgi:hypothetical protein